MRVLLVVDNLSDQDARAALLTLITLLEEQRINLLVCAVREPPADIASQVDVRLGYSRRNDPRAWFALRHIAKTYDVEAIHCLEPGASLTTAIAGVLSDIPTVISIYHPHALLDKGWIALQFQRLVWRTLIRMVNRVMVTSDVARRELVYITDWANPKTEIVYPGIHPPDLEAPIPDRESLGLPTNCRLVTMIPVRAQDAGYEVVFETMVKLLKRQPDAHLVIVGSGQMVIELQRKAAHFRPALPIRWISEKVDLWGVLANSDVVIDCLSRDVFPHGLIMASLAGKPIVAPRLPSVTEIIEGGLNGLLVTPGDSGDLAAQILRILQHEGVSHRLGKMARRRGLERFSMEAYREAVTTLYEATVYSVR